MNRRSAADTRSENVTQSIVAKAFRGELVPTELVPTEAELAEREGREFETAEQLLERVKGERAAVPNGRKKTRKGG